MKAKRLNRNGYVTRRGKWSEEEEFILSELWPDMPSEIIAGVLGRTYESVSCHANLLGIKKSEAYLSSPECGRLSADGKTCYGTRSSFKSGHAPHNKGKKWSEFMSADGQKNARKGHFKTGNLPPQTHPDGDGAITIWHETSRKIKYIRIDLGVWRPLHIYLWENKNGKIPPKHCLWFKDGNTLNAEDLNNLELITRKENRRRNSGAVLLNDKYVVRMLVGTKKNKNEELEKQILEYRPDLVRIKRQQILLNRELKATNGAI